MKLNIGSLNVYRVEAGEERCDQIISLVKEHDLDIVCFQEMTRNAFKKITQNTGMNSIFWFGNMLLTKLTIKNQKNITLPKFRGALKVTLETEDKIQINMVLTHLDHISESNRILQFAVIQPYLDDVDFLIGDLNSLYRADYSKSKMIDIDKKRAVARVERVRYQITDLILKNGFMTNPYIMQTCPYDTRIDYIFFRKEFIKKNKMINKIDEVIDTIKDKVSDHNMIIAKMK